MLDECAGITAKDTSLAAVRKSEELLRAVFNASAELTCVSTIFGVFVEANDAFCVACGRTREEIIGQPGAAINLWVDLARRHEFLEMLGRDGFVCCFEADMRHVSGEVRRCQLSARVIKVDGAPLVVTTAKETTDACQGF